MQLTRPTAAFFLGLALSLFLCSTSSAAPTSDADQSVQAEKQTESNYQRLYPRSEPKKPTSDADEVIK
ncbi:hypothetical protein IWQ62_005647, partial [Dispira parvispora]